MGFVEICGQPLTSVFSIADHCFISSEIGGIFGRSRMVRIPCLAKRIRFAFFVFIGVLSLILKPLLPQFICVALASLAFPGFGLTAMAARGCPSSDKPKRSRLLPRLGKP